LGDLYSKGMAELRFGFTPGPKAYAHHPWWFKKGLRIGAALSTRKRMRKARKREEERQQQQPDEANRLQQKKRKQEQQQGSKKRRKENCERRF